MHQVESVESVAIAVAEGPVATAAARTRELIDLLVRLDPMDPIGAEVGERLAPLVDLLEAHAGPAEDLAAAAGHGEPGFIDRSPVTGVTNPLAPPIRIETDDDGRSSARVRLGLPFQGPSGRVHGGFVAVLLDHVMGTAVRPSATGQMFTRTLTVDYLRATPLFEDVVVSAAVERTDGRKHWVSGRIETSQGVAVRAHGLWLEPRATGRSAIDVSPRPA